LIPNYAGLFSALGLLMADVRVDEVQSLPVSLEQADMALLDHHFRAMEQRALSKMSAERIESQLVAERSIDIRYVGQNHEVTVPLPAGPLTEDQRAMIVERFTREYARMYGYYTDDAREILTLRLAMTGVRKKTTLPLLPPLSTEQTCRGSRDVYVNGRAQSYKVYWGHHLPAGTFLKGPLLIDKPDTTILVHEDEEITVDDFGNILITLPTT
jgi:N-methylhydantoinase A